MTDVPPASRAALGETSVTVGGDDDPGISFLSLRLPKEFRRVFAQAKCLPAIQKVIDGGLRKGLPDPG